MIRRQGRKPDVFNTDVLIVDQQHTSKYFRVSSVPSEFTAGKNMFKIFGNLEYLKLGSQIHISVIDQARRPLYHQVENWNDQTGRALISVWVYPETPPGLATIRIRGIATRRPGGSNVPDSWKNRVNVEWTRELTVNPTKDNTTPILFKTIPAVTIQENIREYLNQSFSSGTSATGSNGLGYIHSAIPFPTIKLPINYTLGSDNFGYIQRDTNSVAAEIFTADMEGAYLSIPFTSGSDDAPIYDLGDYQLAPGATGNYTTYVNEVINGNTIKVSPYEVDVISYNQTAGNRPGDPGSVSAVSDTIKPTSFGPTTNFTMSWQQTPTYLNGGLNSQSYAQITLKNLKPMTGRIDRIKTYVKSIGTSQFELLNESKVRDQNLMVDYTNMEAYYSVGNFRNQTIINDFWTAGMKGGTGSADILIATPTFAEHDSAEMMNGVFMKNTAFLTHTSDWSAVAGGVGDFSYHIFSNSTPINLYKGNDYKIGLKVIAKKQEGQTIDSLMEVYISGSNIPNSDARGIGHKLISLSSDKDVVTSVTEFAGVSTLMQSGMVVAPPVVNDPESIDVVSQFIQDQEDEVSIVTSISPDSKRLELLFEPSKDTTAHLVFATVTGDWYLADVFVQGARDLGFTPSHTFLEIPIATAQADDVLDFRFEFINPAGQVANIALTTQSQDFVGSNLFINGDENQLSGSVTIGGGIVMQGFTD